MRLAIVLVLLALLVAPHASSAESQPRDALAVSILTTDTLALVSWTPAPSAILYEVYRGPSLDALELITTTPATSFLDAETPAGDVWYVIVSMDQAGQLGELIGRFRGSCISHRGTTGISVTAAHCIPARPF